MNPLRIAACILVAVVTAVFVLGILIGCASAQDGRHGIGHAEHHDWYKDLKQPGTGFSCCNGRAATSEGDCRPTRAWQDDDGNWIALLDGRPVPVPPRVVLQQLAPDGRSHICASRNGMIYCFLGGSPKS